MSVRNLLNSSYLDKPMITVWDTTKTGSVDTANDQIALPLDDNLTIDITVDWGDGNVEDFIDSDDIGLIHTYSTPGIYTVKIRRNNGIGTIGWTFNHAPSGRRDKSKILEISQFGNIEVTQEGTSGSQRTFFQCNNLDITATDFYERCIGITSVYTEMFRLCSSMTTWHDIENWDMSHVTNVVGMFWQIGSFNKDISGWDVSNCNNFQSFLSNCTAFNQDLSSWDMSNAVNINSMFASCPNMNFNVGSWNVDNVTTMGSAFSGCTSFVGTGLGNWNTTGVTNMSNMFNNCDSLDTDGIEGWDVGDVTTFYRMFLSNGSTKLATADFSSWDVSSASTLQDMFGVSSFNGNCSGWTLRSTVGVNCYFMFRNTPFNGTVNDWTNTSSITNTQQMFSGCQSFNQPLNNWDMSNVTNMFAMFDDCNAFNSAIFTNTSSLTGSLQSCFRDCDVFNQDISGWTVTNVTNFSSMFVDCTNFNQNLSSWTPTSATNMSSMFSNSAMNADLSSWDISGVTNMTLFASNANFSTANYDLMLVAWDALTLQSGVTLDMGSTTYTMGEVSSGTTTSATTDKLVDSGATFQTDGVAVNDVVYNETDNTWAIVDAVDSETQLSISVDIMTSSELYSIQGSNAAKAKANMILSDSWTITDGGGV